MAGSIRAFEYIGDDGNTYRVDRDESNVTTLNSGFANIDNIPNVQSTPDFPRKWTARYALMYQVSNPLIKRKVTILDPAIFAALSGATDYSLVVAGAAPANFRISALIGEQRKGLTNIDSGQNDGTPNTPQS